LTNKKDCHNMNPKREKQVVGKGRKAFGKVGEQNHQERANDQKRKESSGKRKKKTMRKANIITQKEGSKGKEMSPLNVLRGRLSKSMPTLRRGNKPVQGNERTRRFKKGE